MISTYGLNDYDYGNQIINMILSQQRTNFDENQKPKILFSTNFSSKKQIKRKLYANIKAYMQDQKQKKTNIISSITRK
jgi:serine phosphatase RsbU (regulator of sigma subunit)